MKEPWIIRNIINGLFWSNFTGWGSKDGASLFNEAERLCLNLPIDGEWVLK